MKIGTKSVLYGAHCFLIHPVFVLIAWWKLYGFPWDPRLWIAFFVHDLGYWGKPNMDGEEGETHPELGARIMSWFDWRITGYEFFMWHFSELGTWWTGYQPSYEKYNKMRSSGWRPTVVSTIYNGVVLERPVKKWVDFCRYHSKFYAKKCEKEPSPLYAADKYAMALEPKWLYMIRVKWTGEIQEYMKISTLGALDYDDWYAKTKEHMIMRAYEFVSKGVA